jgi:hypothetical protein
VYRYAVVDDALNPYPIIHLVDVDSAEVGLDDTPLFPTLVDATLHWSKHG